MLFIFAGFGIVGAVPLLVAWILYGATNASGLVCGIIALVLSIPVYPLGIYLNRTRPARDLARRMDARSAQLHALADAGQFYRGPGFPPPSSLADAHQQADDLAVEEYAAIKNKVNNRNTLFWIPVQYWAFISGVIAVIIIVVSVAS
ncbi:MAG: hypothetical protein FWF75_08980 [Propionibacteriaceae bacterium]|nr:hypothetical protein [Propionibacteriaceae bacterium]